MAKEKGHWGLSYLRAFLGLMLSSEDAGPSSLGEHLDPASSAAYLEHLAHSSSVICSIKRVVLTGIPKCLVAALSARPPPPPVRGNQVTFMSLAQVIGTLTAARHGHGGFREGYADTTDPQSWAASLAQPHPHAPPSCPLPHREGICCSGFSLGGA